MTLLEQLQQMLADQGRRSARVEDSARRGEELDRLSMVDARLFTLESSMDPDSDEVDALEMELIELELSLGMG